MSGDEEPAEPSSGSLQPHQPAQAPDIPFPADRDIGPGRQRDARKNIDLELGRIKRRKRVGVLGAILICVFVAFVFIPVAWVGVYRFIEAPSTTLMLIRSGEGEIIRHRPVRLAQMSPNIVRAVIAAEDGKFCTHHGFDVDAIQDAMERNAEGGRIRGASTISQQVAKNLFLWPSRSWLRKGLETYFTSLIEFMWSKDRIMEAYLNSAEWGHGVFGIEAAAQAHFGVSARDLTPLQAARLAAVLPDPLGRDPASPGPYVRRQSSIIVQRAAVVRNEHFASCVLAIDAPPQPSK